MTPEDRQAARARCEAARLGASAEECLRHGPDLLEMACTDLPAALDELDAKDKRIAELEYQVNSFRAGLQLARDLYREKSGKPDRFVGEGDWWNNPDDQCVVLWLIEWAEDIQCDLIDQLSADKTRLEGEVERLRHYERIWNETALVTATHAALEGRDSE